MASMDSLDKHFFNSVQLPNNPTQEATQLIYSGNGSGEFPGAFSPCDEGGDNASSGASASASANQSASTNQSRSAEGDSRTQIKSLRKLVSKLKLAPSASSKPEAKIGRILKSKAKKARDARDSKDAKDRNEKQKLENKAMDDSNSNTGSKTNLVSGSETNSDSGVAVTSGEEDTSYMKEEEGKNTKSTTKNVQKKSKDKPLELPAIKCISSPHITIEDKNEKDDDDDDDIYLDDSSEDDRPLKHANTMPVLAMDRGDNAFPSRVIEEREASFHKEYFFFHQMREPRVSTAQRRASVTIQNLAKDAEADLKHSWLLDEQTKEQWKKFEERKRALTIVIADEDPIAAIEQRLEEVRMMSKPRKDMRHVLERLPEEQKDSILVSIFIFSSSKCAARNILLVGYCELPIKKKHLVDTCLFTVRNIPLPGHSVFPIMCGDTKSYLSRLIFVMA